MTIKDSDVKILKFMNRIARYFYHWATHDKLPMILEYPRETFMDYGFKTMTNYIKNNDFLDMETNEFNCFLVACEMLRRNDELKGAIVDLFVQFRKEEATEEDIKEFREILKNER